MALWKRAAGIIKDQNSIAVAKFCSNNSFRDSEIEASIIKASSHDQHFIDKRNAQRVFSSIRASPISIRPVTGALTRRMKKTRSWVVAIKGLMLIHGVFCCKVPNIHRLGRLPFDFSSFSDGHSKPNKTWGFNCFIRSYFAFLDHKAVFMAEIVQNSQTEQSERSLLLHQLLKIQKWQCLLDVLLQVRPLADNMKVNLIMEAMDCVIIEIFDVYSKLCSEIAKVLLKICCVSKIEAETVLKILQKATVQGEELSMYFEFCNEYGVLNAKEFPTVTNVLDEDVKNLERIIHGVPRKTYKDVNFNGKRQMEMAEREENYAIIEQEQEQEQEQPKGALKTIISDKWVVFDESKMLDEMDVIAAKDVPLVPIHDMPVCNAYHIPDLITWNN